MKFILPALIAMTLASPALAQEPAKLTVKVGGIENGKPIPERFAYCIPDGQGKTKDGQNINPSIEWSGAPEGTKSYVILVVDRDVPQSFELANQEGKVIPREFPRQNFYHWVLVDIPSTMVAIAEGADSRGITKGGKELGKRAYGVVGQNDYARFMGEGPHGGYDGPCPPWNDTRLHRYHFTVYALSVPSVNLSGLFGGQYVEDIIQPHVLAKGEVIGTFTNKPGVY
ncbi:MAG: YbhB/YbcL family Raf kinase inhibitor-like protein [Alphaproteobacteria bacterium]|nr:YbhB/YbcL family Raf kinase inhibitor-like protein [Alphaproteobacteria bacterium]